MHLEFSIEHVQKDRDVSPVNHPISLGIVPVKALSSLAGFCESKNKKYVRLFERIRQ
jgi:hypothetical protein